MGKNFPQIISLKEKPDCLEKTLQLIEKSFHYKAPHRFEKDFAPLIDQSNHHNCFILIDENENVLAHIGAKQKFLEIKGHRHPICLLGGIAVAEEKRGEGHFQTLMQEMLAEKRSDTAAFLLWSDLESLYRKFGFYLCGNQFELESIGGEGDFTQSKYKFLSTKQKESVRALYESSFAKSYLTPMRSPEDWELIEKISSADLFILTNNDEISDYFFMNKGQDLPGIVYEYGSSGKITDVILKAQQYGKVWMGSPLIETELLQFQFFLSIGDARLFTQLISDLTDNQMKIVNINIMKQELFFEFNGETLVMGVEEFLRGILGPGSFEELGESKPLFISGLDSI